MATSKVEGFWSSINVSTQRIEKADSEQLTLLSFGHGVVAAEECKELLLICLHRADPAELHELAEGVVLDGRAEMQVDVLNESRPLWNGMVLLKPKIPLLGSHKMV